MKDRQFEQTPSDIGVACANTAFWMHVQKKLRDLREQLKKLDHRTTRSKDEVMHKQQFTRAAFELQSRLCIQVRQHARVGPEWGQACCDKGLHSLACHNNLMMGVCTSWPHNCV